MWSVERLECMQICQSCDYLVASSHIVRQSHLTLLRQHIGWAHGKSRQTNALANLNELGTELKCSVVCCTYECSNTSQLIKHLKQHIDEGSRVECPLIGCQKNYCVKSSFTCHLSRDHISWALSDLKQETQLMLTTGSTRLAVSRGQQTWYHSTCYI